MLFVREPRHGDHGRDDPAPLAIEVARCDRDDPAQVPAASERLQGERGRVDSQGRSGACPAPQHRADLLPQHGRGRGLEAVGGMLPGELAGGIEQPDPRAELTRELGDGRPQAIGPECGERDRPLRRQRPRAAGVGGGCDIFGVRSRDGDERRAVGHLEQRHARGSAGVDQRSGNAVAHDFGAESHAGHAPVGQSRDVRRIGVVGDAVELASGRQEHESLREERRGIGQVAGVHPAHLARQLLLVDGVQEAQRQIAATQQRRDGGVRRGGGHAASSDAVRLV